MHGAVYKSALLLLLLYVVICGDLRYLGRPLRDTFVHFTGTDKSAGVS